MAFLSFLGAARRNHTSFNNMNNDSFLSAASKKASNVRMHRTKANVKMMSNMISGIQKRLHKLTPNQRKRAEVILSRVAYI